MRDDGFDVEGPLRYPDGYLVVSPGSDPRNRLTLRALNADDPDGRDRFGEVSQHCEAQWYYAVERMWDKQFEPTEQEIRAWLERAWDCAEEQGVPLGNPPTQDDAITAVAHGCEPWLTDA